MNMVAGLEVPTSGSIFFNSQDMTRAPAGKRGVGFVFQNYAIFAHMTVEEVFNGLPRWQGKSGRISTRPWPKSAILLELRPIIDDETPAGSTSTTCGRRWRWART